MDPATDSNISIIYKCYRNRVQPRYVFVSTEFCIPEFIVACDFVHRSVIDCTWHYPCGVERKGIVCFHCSGSHEYKFCSWLLITYASPFCDEIESWLKRTFYSCYDENCLRNWIIWLVMTQGHMNIRSTICKALNLLFIISWMRVKVRN